MARARRETPADETAATETPAQPATTTPRLSLTLDESGGIAWDRMRPATQEQLKAALAKDPNAATRLGLASAATAAEDAIDNSSLAAILYGSASTLMVGLARRSGYTAEQAAVLAFNEQEIGLLAEPTGKVLNKWLPTGKYQDEMMLGLLLTTIISGKLAMLKKTAPVVHMVPTNAAAAAGEALTT